jgi:hypothetical protein
MAIHLLQPGDAEGNVWRQLLEKLLPWYNPKVERLRDARSRQVQRRSVVTRARAERIISEYRDADKVADKATEALITEVRRDK